MGFGQAISAGFANYVNFHGRACRSEYWFWVLFYFLGAIVTLVLNLALDIQVANEMYSIVMALPTISVAIRRLHDLDRTGWWILLGLIPLLGWIVQLIFSVTKGTDGPNRFGPDPLATLAIPAAPRAG
jgi:uncharacterized membrane protein YhaH (DUF805 family)